MTGRFTLEALDAVQAEASSIVVDLQLALGALSVLRDRDGKDLGDDNPLKDVVARLHAARHTLHALVAVGRSHPSELAEYRQMSAEREAPPAGGFELRGFAPGPGGNWERIAHPAERVVELDVAESADGTERHVTNRSAWPLVVERASGRSEPLPAGASAVLLAGDSVAQPTAPAERRRPVPRLDELAALLAVVRDQRQLDDRRSPEGVPVEAPAGHVAIHLVDRELDVLESALEVLTGAFVPLEVPR